jgi:hypothetical protein
MKIALERIESSVQESFLLIAEELLEQEQPSPLYEIEKNLWVANISGHEVEVQLSARNVTGGSCDCQNFIDTGECEHFVAALLQLRKQLKPRRTAPAKKRTRNSQKLTTAVVLEQASREELVEFVRAYARSHRNFAIALKARFASSVSQIDQKEKYEQLLNSTISTIRKPDRSITIRGAQKLLKVLRELDLQLTEAIADNDLLEASYMARSIIEKISPLLSKINGKKKEIRQLILNAFEHLSGLLQQNPAPSLVKEIWQFATKEYARLTYRPSGLDLSFIKLMQQMASSEKEYQALMDGIEVLKEKYSQENRTATPLLLAELSVLEQAGQKEAAKRMMEQNLNEPEVLYYAIEQAQLRNQRPRVKALAETGLKLGFPTQEEARLTNLLLRMAVEDGDTAAIYKYALDRFIDTLNFTYYQQAFQYANDSWAEEVNRLLSNLQQRPYSIKSRSAIAMIYAKEDRLDELVSLLEEIGSINLLLEFGGFVYKAYPERMNALYRKLLDEYTQQHLGRKAAVRVREVVSHLHEIGAVSLAREITEVLRQSYPERHSLMEELSIFESA